MGTQISAIQNYLAPAPQPWLKPTVFGNE